MQSLSLSESCFAQTSSSPSAAGRMKTVITEFRHFLINDNDSKIILLKL